MSGGMDMVIAMVKLYNHVHLKEQSKRRQREYQKRRQDELQIELALSRAREGPFYPNDSTHRQVAHDKPKGRINPYYPQNSPYNQVTPAAKKG
jgi:hypothetical protein